MTLGLHETRVRRRRRFWWGVIKLVLTLFVIIGLGTYSYVGGRQIAERKVEQQAERMAELEAAVTRLESEKATLDRQLQAAVRDRETWQARYESDVPSGPITALIALVQEKLGEGTDTDRLRYLIENAAKPRACDEPTTRRFLVATPFQGDARQSVGFAENAITVTASGESARDENGNVEAWFDPAAPVEIVFAQLNGENSTANGSLPIFHSLVTEDNEYEFNASAGAQGYLTVTGRRCDFP